MLSISATSFIFNSLGSFSVIISLTYTKLYSKIATNGKMVVMSKVNWALARTDYISDEQLSYQDIAGKYSVSKTSVVKKAVKEGWQGLRRETSLKVIQKLPEKIGETIAQINQRHAYFGKLLQARALEAILKGDVKPKTFREAVLCVKEGIEMERKALGLDKEQQMPSEMRVNFGSREAGG